MTSLKPPTPDAPSRSADPLRLFLAQLYSYAFLDELIFIYPLYAVMFADFGLSPARISLLFTAWCLTGLLLEIPSGALADKVSRKHILLGAQVVRIFGFGCWMMYPTFWGFLLGFVCWGISGAFCSGTFEAVVFDELKHFGHARSYAKVMGRVVSISLTAIVVASACTSHIAGLGYRSITALSLASMAASCVPLLFIRPVARAESTREREYLHLLRQGVGEAMKNRAVRGLLAFICFGLILGALEEYWPVIGRELGLSRKAISLFFAADYAVAAGAAAVAHRFEHFSNRSFYVAYALAGALLLVTALLMRPAGMLLILTFTFLLGVTGVVFEARVQHAISVEARATVLSVKGFFSEVGAIPVFLGFGVAASHWGYLRGLGVCAAVMIAVGLLWSAFGSRESLR